MDVDAYKDLRAEHERIGAMKPVDAYVEGQRSVRPWGALAAGIWLGIVITQILNVFFHMCYNR